MYTNRRTAVAALTAAGLLWGTTVPLSRLALAWLPPAWLTFARFGLAAAILLVAARPKVRAACTPAVLAWGAMGYGGSVVVQNAGIARTSVSHAALLIGAAPVLVAIIAARWQHSVARPVAWAGYAVSLAGVGLVAGGGGGGATVSGDGLVMASLLLSATFTVAQTRLLHGRDPVAVTAVQFLAAAAAVLPVAVTAEGMPAVSGSPGALLATAGLAIGGTLLPFTLFAYGQSRVSAEIAGAFLNLEPLVGAAAGAVFFGDPAGPAQIAGGAAILAGITLGSAPLLTGRRREPQDPPAPAARAETQVPGQRHRPADRKPAPIPPACSSCSPRTAGQAGGIARRQSWAERSARAHRGAPGAEVPAAEDAPGPAHQPGPHQPGPHQPGPYPCAAVPAARGRRVEAEPCFASRRLRRRTGATAEREGIGHARERVRPAADPLVGQAVDQWCHGWRHERLAEAEQAGEGEQASDPGSRREPTRPTVRGRDAA
jgi:O-acetylserine/cysteine efflux transporter